MPSGVPLTKSAVCNVHTRPKYIGDGKESHTSYIIIFKEEYRAVMEDMQRLLAHREEIRQIKKMFKQKQDAL